MGNQGNASIEGPYFCANNYPLKKSYRLPWSDNFTILYGINDRKAKKVIEKKVGLRNSAELFALLSRFQQCEETPFFLLRPLHVKAEDEGVMCTEPSTLAVYHNDLLPTLEHKMQSDQKNACKESTIWFLLNEVTHSLDILYSKDTPHLWVSPETIYCNENENWLLQDMSFWWGFDLQSLLQKKHQHQNQIMSPEMKGWVHNRQPVDLETAKDEDVFCLGYTLLYMMTSIPHPVLIQVRHQILKNCQFNYSDKLVGLVASMSEPNPRKRISFERLKLKLKIDEDKIIGDEMMEYQKGRRDSKKQAETSVFQRSLISEHRSSIKYQSTRFETEHRMSISKGLFLSPQTDRRRKNITSPTPKAIERGQRSSKLEPLRIGSSPSPKILKY